MIQPGIYERLYGLPLFQGMNNTDLVKLVGHTKLDFHRYPAGHVIIRDGSPCNFLCFLMSGTLRVTTESTDRNYALTEELSAPEIAQPECIFGLNQHFTRTFTAKTNCNCMMLDKTEVMRITAEYEIFRINLLNILSTQTQRLQRHLWHQQPTTLEQRIGRFVEAHCLRPAGPKTLKIKMTRLAEELNDSRLDISHALNNLKAQGLIILHRGYIEIADMKNLLNM